VFPCADVLYEPEYYGDLLSCLIKLCPVGVLFWTCYRQRTNLNEDLFEARAGEAGFEVQLIADRKLHVHYQDNGYRLLRLERVRM
jgi:hypothetical protein